MVVSGSLSDVWSGSVCKSSHNWYTRRLRSISTNSYQRGPVVANVMYRSSRAGPLPFRYIDLDHVFEFLTLTLHTYHHIDTTFLLLH